MPRTRSQQGLEEETEVVPSSHDPVVISGVPPWIAGLLTAVLLIIMAVLLSAVVGGNLQLGPAPEITIGGEAPGQPAPPPANTQPGTVLAGDTPILPLPPDGLAPYADRTVRGTAVPVFSVVADEGFWVGTDDRNRLYVVYQTGGLESPPDVDAGDLVSFTGSLQPSTGELAPQFRLTEAEGLGYLQSQGYFISVASVEINQEAPVEEPQ
jgi:hypothetical protein